MVGPILSSFQGEFSETVHDLADLIATKQAAEYSLSHTMKPSHAKSMFKQRLYRLWGLYAHRGWANLLFQRCRILLKHRSEPGLAPGDSGESESHMHMEFNHCHPGRGGSTSFRGDT